MRERTKLGSVATRLSLFLGVAIIAICFAQVVGLSLSISKTVLQFDNLPGTTGDASFIIRNNDAHKVTVRIRLVDWEDTPDGRTLLSPANSLSRSCASWVRYTPQSFDLLPGQEEEIHVTMATATSASGTYWTAFLVDTPEDSTLAANGIRATTQFLIKLYQTSLPAATSGKIVDVTVAGLSPLGTTLRFVNTGETLMQDVRATATLQDRAGHKLEQKSSDPFSVLPDHAIDITLTTSIDMQIPGIYLVTAIVDFGADFVVAGQVSFQVKPLSLTPIGSSTDPPQDLDGNGLYEDVNGDGRLTDDDLSLFETHLNDACIVKNVRAFDYNNDGKIAQDDVDKLRSMLARQSQISGD
jgi:PKD repeat protein